MRGVNKADRFEGKAKLRASAKEKQRNIQQFVLLRITYNFPSCTYFQLLLLDDVNNTFHLSF